MDANIIFFIDRFWPYKARSQSSIASRRLGQTGRKWIIWAVKIAAFTFFSSITSAIAKLSNPPQLLYTDIVSGPNEGGENNKGAYLSLFGRHFGDTGVGTRVKVFINDIEVDNYRYLGPANSIPNLQKITVQIGSLGNPVMGLRLPIKVVVDGLSSNTNHYFIVNPGTIYFLSLKGSDFRGDGSFMNPFRTLQTANIKLNRSQGCPVTEGNQPITVAGVWGLLKPGDIVVMRGGTWTDVAIDGFFLRVQNKSGSVPTGMSGTGFITVMGYPGESIFIDRTNTVGDNQSGGGIASADSARQRLGCGAWIAISNLKIESGFNDGSVNTQQGNSNPKGSHWRVVNNELTAKSCQISTKCRAAGIAGNGKDNFWVGNHIHDVYDKPDGVTDFENHGVYIDGDGSYEVAYNRIENIIGGNGIQAHSASGGIINNVNVHHNVIHGVGKHGINLSSGSTENFLIYQNIVYGSDMAGIRFSAGKLHSAKVFNNTFFDTDRLDMGSPRAAVMNDAVIETVSLEFKNNIVVPGNENRAFLGGSVGFAAAASSSSHNLWYLGKSCKGAWMMLSKSCTLGAPSFSKDPQFATTKRGMENFRLLVDSPARGAGEVVNTALVPHPLVEQRTLNETNRVDLGAYDLVQ